MEEKIGAGGEPQTYNPDDGRYTGKGTTYRQNTSYDEILQRSKQSGAISGAQSGALDPEGEDSERAQKHADLMYNTFRNISSDVAKISQITGHSEDEIKRVKNHMFFNEYELYGGKHRFYPDYYQAQSWDRLRKGIPIEMDFVMIEHELIEERLMRENGLSYEEAHKEANKTANYEKKVKEYRNGEIKKKRN